MEDQNAPRLRPHPDERFAAAQHPFNLNDLASKLQQERGAGEGGHRQETLYKQGGVTVSLFLFEHLTRLPPHRAKGIVTIHVLAGHLQITTPDQVHNLHAGNLLILAQGVQHDVLACQETTMLLTVNLGPSATSS